MLKGGMVDTLPLLIDGRMVQLWASAMNYASSE
jgi:hypothetical protein